MENQIATVKYSIATYEGEISVQCDENDDNDAIIAKARSILRRRVGHFPFGSQSWKVVERN